MKSKISTKNKISTFFKEYKWQLIIITFLMIISSLFIFNSNKYIRIVLEGIVLFGTKVLPALLPFLFITKILSSFNLIGKICEKFSFLTKFLFSTPSISFYIFFMSIISGYPVGAKLTCEFYEKKIITSHDAQKILAFCSTSGPLFVIGSVGVGFYFNARLGFLLFLSHIISSILNGIIFGHAKIFSKREKNFNNSLCNIDKTNVEFSLDDCMFSTIKSAMMVGGFVVIFFVLIQILLDSNLLSPFIKLFTLFGLSELEATGFVSGLIEITKGVNILAKSPNILTSFMLSSFVISFSGISILTQSIVFLEKSNVSKKIFIFQKLTHAILSLVISYFIGIIFL